jgi:hypothetical protein
MVEATQTQYERQVPDHPSAREMIWESKPIVYSKQIETIGLSAPTRSIARQRRKNQATLSRKRSRSIISVI